MQKLKLHEVIGVILLDFQNDRAPAHHTVNGIQLLLLIFVLVCTHDTLAQNNSLQPKLFWIGDAHGDIHRASILAERQSSSNPKDYLVLLNPKKFDPFQMYQVAEDRNPIEYFDRIMLLVELPPDSSMLDYHLSISINKAVPVCGFCDGGCFRLMERKTQTITAVLNSGTERLRYLINVSDFIVDWHLMDIDVNATLSLNRKQILESRMKAEQWPWCL